jgi:hypothetical protein
MKNIVYLFHIKLLTLDIFSVSDGLGQHAAGLTTRRMF